MKKIQIYDTTLRDGSQGEDISFSVDDKLHIARKLDELGIDYIEGGWPGSNFKDMAFFKRVPELSLKHARVAAFGSTAHPKNSKVEDDNNIQALIESGTPVVTIFGKSWDLHVKVALGISLERNIELIRDSVAYLKSLGKEVIYDAEHFFDGFQADRDYALSTLKAAEQAGADTIVLCDTNGGTLTEEIRDRTLSGPVDAPAQGVRGRPVRPVEPGRPLGDRRRRGGAGHRHRPPVDRLGRRSRAPRVLGPSGAPRPGGEPPRSDREGGDRPGEEPDLFRS